MENYIRLSDVVDQDNNVDFIANKTKSNYINLRGINPKDTIDCVHRFLCRFGVWDISDNVTKSRRPINFIPDPKLYHDISFVLNFYNAACISKETRDREKQESQTIVKQLANPNINHNVPMEGNDIVRSINFKTKNKKQEPEKIVDDNSSDLEDIIELSHSDKESSVSEKSSSEDFDSLPSDFSDSEFSEESESEKKKKKKKTPKKTPKTKPKVSTKKKLAKQKKKK